LALFTPFYLFSGVASSSSAGKPRSLRQTSSPLALRSLKDYERQKKQGIEPMFDPSALGINDSEYWHGVSEQG
jgi:hypothetical protein